MDFYYGKVKTPFAEGKAFRNPGLFLKTDPAATRVFIVGDFPDVAEAYKAANVPVYQIGINDRDVLYGQGKRLRTSESREKQLAVHIPDDWEQMPWADLRRLAASVSNFPIISKHEAQAAIRAELQRRKQEQDNGGDADS